MAKTAAPSRILLTSGATFITNAVPDVFDARDLQYRPRLQPLPDREDRRDAHRHVLQQDGSSCTGHAVAAMINTVFAQTRGTTAPRVSPYMLYYLARRYDEFAGEADEGSSLRGVLKGWWHHGVALENEWPRLHTRRDLDEPALLASCQQRPLGAFYRVNASRLDDLQSAVCELHAIVASSMIHDGWITPRVETINGETMHVIRRGTGQVLGGHAYALVGYNHVGFLVQNSWGKDWGKGGFATLPYEEWLETAYDAWVARPGVPHTPIARARQHVVGGRGDLQVQAGPDVERLRRHVVNLGNDGRLSTNGRITSSPTQLANLMASMQAAHTAWGTRDVVLFAHGGLVSEAAGLEIAQEQLSWWLNNHVYPVFFVWQSGAGEVVLDELADAVRRLVPFAAGFDLAEGIDRLVERAARRAAWWAWSEMKENARRASKPVPTWPPTSEQRYFDLPGVTILLRLLQTYAQAHPGVRLHLVGHSAGTILQGALLSRAREYQLPIQSISFLAAALRTDDFLRDVVPHLGSARFANFVLSDQRELDDTCKAGAFTVYRKSLLYLVSRGFERPTSGEVPLLGMDRFSATSINGVSARSAMTGGGGAWIVAPSTAPVDARCDASSHGGFDEDVPTMTSVLLRIKGTQQLAPVHIYRPNAPLTATMPIAPVAVAITRRRATSPLVPAGAIPVTDAVLPAKGPVDTGERRHGVRKTLRRAREVRQRRKTED